MRLSCRTCLWVPLLAAALASAAVAQTQPAGSTSSAPALQRAPVAGPEPQTKVAAHAGAPAVDAAKPAAARPSVAASAVPAPGEKEPTLAPQSGPGEGQLDFTSMLFVFMLATFIGIGVVRRVSRLLHTPLMSLTNAISAIAVVGSIMVAGGMREYPVWIRTLGAIALFCSMTNIVSGFLITDRMLKMFKTREGGKP